MIKVTEKAANQIRSSAKLGQMEGIPLRIAAKKNEDGSIHYGLGFDDQSKNDDTEIKTNGISIVVNAQSAPLVMGMEIDYVELEPGKPQFIFKNPNDPNYSPPTEE